MILACAGIAGCGSQKAEYRTKNFKLRLLSLVVYNVRGHDYLVASAGGSSISVVHAASCPCMAPKMHSIEELVTTNRIPDIGDYLMEAK